MAITYQEMVRWHDARHMHVHQNFFEFCGWLNEIECIQPRYMIEIGTYQFGTAQMTLEALPSIERLITVDTVDRWNEHLAKLEPYGDRLQFVQGDSRSLATRERVARLLRGHAADGLFIDGDHSYLGVMNDFIVYSALVRPGGLIGFHDCLLVGIGTGPGQLGSEVFWEGLCRCYPQRTKLVQADPGPWGNYGLGIFRM
jgi:cephalosporin hydroxylase